MFLKFCISKALELPTVQKSYLFQEVLRFYLIQKPTIKQIQIVKPVVSKQTVKPTPTEPANSVANNNVETIDSNFDGIYISNEILLPL